MEAQARRRIEEGVNLLARQPGAGARLVERAPTRRRDVPLPAQSHFFRAEPRVVDPDALQGRGHRIQRKEMSRRCKAQARGVTCLHLRAPGPGVALDLTGEAACGLFERVVEVGRGPCAAHHAAKRGVAEFYSFALGVLPALDRRVFHGRFGWLKKGVNWSRWQVSNPRPRDPKSRALPSAPHRDELVPAGGNDPPTCALSRRCSATELREIKLN